MHASLNKAGAAADLVRKVHRMSESAISSLPSLKGLHALARLSQARSLAVAAEELGVTRSALSHRIGDLEAQLGVALVRRQGRSLALTDDGEALLAAIGDAVERIEAAVKPLQRRHHELRLSTVATFATLWLLPRMGSFRERHPGVNLSITTTQRVVDFEDEDLDCAIRHGLGGWPGLTATLLFRETLIPVAAPGVGDRLGDAPAIRARSRFADWQRWIRAVGSSEVVAQDGLVVETRAQALEAVLGGAGATLMDRAYVVDLIKAGRLRTLGPSLDLQEGYWFVHRPKPRNERLVRMLREWLLEEASSASAAAVTSEGLDRN